jgi:hypothetical protein
VLLTFSHASSASSLVEKRTVPKPLQERGGGSSGVRRAGPGAWQLQSGHRCHPCACMLGRPAAHAARQEAAHVRQPATGKAPLPWRRCPLPPKRLQAPSPAPARAALPTETCPSCRTRRPPAAPSTP